MNSITKYILNSSSFLGKNSPIMEYGTSLNFNLYQLRCSLIWIPAGVFSSVEEKLLSKFFDVSIQHRTNFRSEVFWIQKNFVHRDLEFSMNFKLPLI